MTALGDVRDLLARNRVTQWIKQKGEKEGKGRWGEGGKVRIKMSHVGRREGGNS